MSPQESMSYEPTSTEFKSLLSTVDVQQCREHLKGTPALAELDKWYAACRCDITTECKVQLPSALPQDAQSVGTFQRLGSYTSTGFENSRGPEMTGNMETRGQQVPEIGNLDAQIIQGLQGLIDQGTQILQRQTEVWRTLSSEIENYSGPETDEKYLSLMREKLQILQDISATRENIRENEARLAELSRTPSVSPTAQPVESGKTVSDTEVGTSPKDGTESRGIDGIDRMNATLHGYQQDLQRINGAIGKIESMSFSQWTHDTERQLLSLQEQQERLQRSIRGLELDIGGAQLSNMMSGSGTTRDTGDTSKTMSTNIGGVDMVKTVGSSGNLDMSRTDLQGQFEKVKRDISMLTHDYDFYNMHMSYIDEQIQHHQQFQNSDGTFPENVRIEIEALHAEKAQLTTDIADIDEKLTRARSSFRQLRDSLRTSPSVDTRDTFKTIGSTLGAEPVRAIYTPERGGDAVATRLSNAAPEKTSDIPADLRIHFDAISSSSTVDFTRNRANIDAIISYFTQNTGSEFETQKQVTLAVLGEKVRGSGMQINSTADLDRMMRLASLEGSRMEDQPITREIRASIEAGKPVNMRMDGTKMILTIGDEIREIDMSQPFTVRQGVEGRIPDRDPHATDQPTEKERVNAQVNDLLFQCDINDRECQDKTEALLKKAAHFNKVTWRDEVSVMAIQRAVGADPDGKMGTETVKKIIIFQHLNGLERDGRVGGGTADKINALTGAGLNFVKQNRADGTIGVYGHIDPSKVGCKTVSSQEK